MTSPYLWDEALPDMFPEIDWSPIVDWDEVSDALDGHVDASRDFMPPTPSGSEIYAINHGHEVDHLKAEVARLEREVETYRSSVARRRGVPLTNVRIDNGLVMYG